LKKKECKPQKPHGDQEACITAAEWKCAERKRTASHFDELRMTYLRILRETGALLWNSFRPMNGNKDGVSEEAPSCRT